MLKLNFEPWHKAFVNYFGSYNQAFSIAHNPFQYDRIKHINVDKHFIKEKFDSGLICTLYVSSQEQLTNILTKGLNSSNFERIVFKLGMENTYSTA